MDRADRLPQPTPPLPPFTPFAVAFVRTVAFGTLAGVHLPAENRAVPEEVLGGLHPQELDIARTLGGFRQIEWVGGRLAWAAAFAAHPGSRGQACPALLRGDGGEPLPPPGVSLSVTHKRTIALSLIGDLSVGTVGIDLEELGRDRSAVAPKVLRAEELAAMDALPAEQRWPFVCTAFALKEATYKAIFPHVRRYVSFHEATVTGALSSASPTVVFHARPGEAQLTLTALVERLGDSGEQLLAMVRAHA